MTSEWKLLNTVSGTQQVFNNYYPHLANISLPFLNQTTLRMKFLPTHNILCIIQWGSQTLPDPDTGFHVKNPALTYRELSEILMQKSVKARFDFCGGGQNLDTEDRNCLWISNLTARDNHLLQL